MRVIVHERGRGLAPPRGADVYVHLRKQRVAPAGFRVSYLYEKMEELERELHYLEVNSDAHKEPEGTTENVYEDKYWALWLSF